MLNTRLTPTQPTNALGRGVRRLPTKKTSTLQVPTGTGPNIARTLIPTTSTLPGCPIVQPGTELNIPVTQREKQKILALAQAEEENLPTLIIENTLLTIISEEELRALAVVKVTIPSTDANILGSVNDSRMGVIDENKLCASCHKDTLECPGHLGYIELNTLLYHPLFLRQIISVLSCVCNSCGGLLLSREEIERRGLLKYSAAERLTMLEEASKDVPCTHKHTGENIKNCVRNPTYLPARLKDTKKIMYTIQGAKGEKKAEHEKTIEEVYSILKTISAEDAELMGFSNGSHPKRMILRLFPVIPPCVRTPVIQDGQIWADHLTTMYIDIVKTNNAIKTAANESDREKFITNLNFMIEHFIDNTDAKYSQGNRKEFLSLKQRIQGKEALIRGLLMGKRVNYSARTVLSPDPNLKFGQIRIPKVMAPYLTVPVTIATFNQEAMTTLLREGKITHLTPGSGKLKGRRIRVDDRLRNQHILQPGDKVDRWLQNGDFIIFNRQPTLHKQGMMGYEVVLGDPLTIGLHLSVTTAHNADFDKL